MAYLMDFFAADVLSKVTAAIEANSIQYPAYVFIRSDDGSNTGRLAFVDKGNELKFIVGGESKSQVIRVDELPAVESGEMDVLYIYNDVVYSFNGTDYVPTYKDHSAELEELSAKVLAVEENIGTIEAKNVELEEKTTTLEQAITKLDKKENIYMKKSYEITNVPVGTLVDYRDKEIRVMCPVNTIFTKQNVGTTGNANYFYMAFKAYAPEDAVSFKEGDQGIIEDEMFDFTGDFAGTDEYGRNYSIVWFALASYEEATDTWTYFGKNSNANKYIGWNYVVEWYNADGIVIASDGIRINLSNEDCHSIIEPYYVNKIVDMSEELEALNDKLTSLEENVAELEESTMTFVELE